VAIFCFTNPRPLFYVSPKHPILFYQYHKSLKTLKMKVQASESHYRRRRDVWLGRKAQWGYLYLGGLVQLIPFLEVGNIEQTVIVACITVGGSRNGPSPTTNSTPKSEASTANSTSTRINRFFDFWTSLALCIHR